MIYPWPPPSEVPALIAWADDLALARRGATADEVLNLRKLAATTDDMLACAVADAVGHVGTPASDAWPEMVALLADRGRPHWVRDTAAYALGMIGVCNAAVTAALVRAAAEKGDAGCRNVAAVAAEALASLAVAP